jgi:hypothetical protein
MAAFLCGYIKGPLNFRGLSKNTLKTSGVSPRMKAYQPKAGNNAKVEKL